jgi:transcriptional regulator with XRE-family HTH domain
MSQVALAEQVGVSFQQIQKYARGADRVSASVLVRTAAALGVPVLDLLDPGATGGLPQDVRELLAVFEIIKSERGRQAVVAIARAIAALG